MATVTSDGILTKSLNYLDDGMLQKETDRGNSTEYTYTEKNSVDSLTYSVGTHSSVVDYNYIPASGQIEQLDTETIDTIAKNGSVLIDFDYFDLDNLDKLIVEKKQNETETSLTYDPSKSKLLSYINEKNDGTVFDDYSYHYDENNNIDKIISNSGISEYQYDNLNQLITEILENGTLINYQYDNVGNRKNKTVIESDGDSISTTYNVNEVNQIDSVNGTPYYYDKDGNLLTDGKKTYIYNELDQLIEVKDQNDTTILKAKYDNEGRRIQSETSLGIINYFYDGNHVIYETNSNNEVTVEYTWDDFGHPVAMTKNGVTYYYNLNGHGDVVSLTDENGNIVATYQYDAWGNIISQSGSIDTENPYRYAGYRYDEITSLYCLNARYYNPELGRFITKDTYEGDITNPLTLNLYTYVSNNPTRNIDPSGNYQIEGAGGVGASTEISFQSVWGDFKTGLGMTFHANWKIIMQDAYSDAKKGFAMYLKEGPVGEKNYAILTDGKFTKQDLNIMFMAYVNFQVGKGNLRIMNKKYAGGVYKLEGKLAKKYPKGVSFSKEGFPDFSTYSIAKFKIKGLKGDTYYDFKAADKLLGTKGRPKDYTWHHVEDGVTMMLVPKDIHNAVRHTGGAAIIRNGLTP